LRLPREVAHEADDVGGLLERGLAALTLLDDVVEAADVRHGALRLLRELLLQLLDGRLRELRPPRQLTEHALGEAVAREHGRRALRAVGAEAAGRGGVGVCRDERVVPRLVDDVGVSRHGERRHVRARAELLEGVEAAHESVT